MRKTLLRKFHVILCGAMMFLLCSSPVFATYAKFDIPGDFPGDFRIDFLGTDFKLSGSSTNGGLSTASTIDFSVGAETIPGSGIYDVTVSPSGFQFLGFEALAGLPFDVYGVGVGSGTFDASTGDWFLDMPTMFVHGYYDTFRGWYGSATLIDLHLGTQNIQIPAINSYPAYDTTTATPMILDPNDPNWGDLNLVAGGLVPNHTDLLLSYDWTLINAIAANYDFWDINTDPFVNIQYEFDIYGNDPRISAVPEPSSLLLIASGLVGLVRLRKNR